jgi:hypothetical protein
MECKRESAGVPPRWGSGRPTGVVGFDIEGRPALERVEG